MTIPRAKRIYRYFDTTLGAYQVTSFPDDPPPGAADIDRWIQHITEIDTRLQALIDQLDQQTEDLVAQVNQLSAERPQISRAAQRQAEEWKEK